MSKSLLNAVKPQAHTVEVYGPDAYEFRPIREKTPPHTRMPPMRNGKTPNRGPDLLDLLGGLSKKARDLFLEIKSNMDFVTYTATLPNDKLTQSQKNKRTAAIKELESTGSGLAARVPQSGVINLGAHELRCKPSTFMLSPEYLWPNQQYEERIMHIWNQCITYRRGTNKTKP